LIIITKIRGKLEGRKRRRHYESLRPENCWHAEGYETVGTNFICARCGALVNNTPFGKKLLMEDPREQFPEVANLDVERWKDPVHALMQNRSKSEKKSTTTP